MYSHPLSSNPAPLLPEAFLPLPLGTIKPGGWLKDELRLQANGITGHIEDFWPDLGPRNMWLGGDREGWERGPYYLDGLIPLASLLDDERLKQKADRWVDAILSRQMEDGWIGPVHAPDRRPYDIWPVMVAVKALMQHHEATGDPRSIAAIERFCEWLRTGLDRHPLFEWGHYRWTELALGIYWLYRRTRQTWLLELARKAADQGYDWTAHFTNFIYTRKTPREECTLKTHVVNGAMGIKAPGVRWLLSHEEADRQAVFHALENLDRYHGQVTGVFTGDEHYAGKDPTQGTELCAVVEYLFSLEFLLSAMGEPSFGDRLERIAFNALPAANTPDMWAHQYDQQVNQVLCSAAPRHWTNNDDTSNLFGLEPNYGCCTANLHQGWPKLAASLWMATRDGGLAAMVYAPCEVTAPVGRGSSIRLHVETDYPFRDRVTITVRGERPVSFPLSLRIPAWADRSEVIADGEAMAAIPGAFLRIEREWKSGDTVELRFPMALRAERRERGAVALLRGPLVLSLRVGEEWRRIGGEEPYADREIHPTTPWNYGLRIDPRNPAASLSVEERPITRMPFDKDHPPVVARVKGKRIPEWRMEMNSAGPIPESPVASTEPEEVLEMIPYGSTQLRMTELPVLAGDPGMDSS